MSEKAFTCIALVALVLQNEEGKDYRIDAGDVLELPESIYRTVSAYVDVVEAADDEVVTNEPSEAITDETATVEAIAEAVPGAAPVAQATDTDAATGKGKSKKAAV